MKSIASQKTILRISAAILLFSFFCTLSAFGQGVTFSQAYNLVKQNMKAKEPDVWVYGSDVVLKAKSSIAIGRKTITSPSVDAWYFFIDDNPKANWSHLCRFAFVDKNTGKYYEIIDNMPPNTLDKLKIQTSIAITPSSGFFDFKSNGLGCGGTRNRDYAVIISGGYDKNNNHIRYYGDCQAIYKTLTQVYGYKKSNIYVLMADGTNAAVDRSDGTNSPTDLDGDGSADIGYSATKANVTAVFNILKNKPLGASDHLFVFTTDHGGGAATGTSSTLNLWNYETMTDVEFATEVNKVKAGQMSIVMEQCYSGGFVDNLAAAGRVIMTAANANEYSWAGASYPTYDEFVFLWTAAITGQKPDGSPVNADANSDGSVSMKEAFDYAKNHDTSAEHPQYSSTPSNFGENMTLNGIKGRDLWMQDTPDDIGLEPNTQTSTFWISEDIWVRNTNDGFTTKTHQNPIFYTSNPTKPNYVYVRVRNRGCAQSLANKNVKLYWAKASTALAWTAPWDGSQFIPATATPMGGSIGAKLTNVISSGGEQILEYQWVVPDPALYSYFGADATHFCLLARIEESNTSPYGMTSPEGFYLSPNVQANNNIAWKNISILTSNSPVAGVVVGNPWKIAMKADFKIKFSTTNFLSFFDVFLELNSTVYDKLKKGGFKMEGAKLSGNVLQFTNQNATLYNMDFNAGEFSWFKFKIVPKTTTAFSQLGLFFDVNQIATGTGVSTQTLGGERFIISSGVSNFGTNQSGNREDTNFNTEIVPNGITVNAFPNPSYDGHTTITYSLDRSDNVSLTIFNAMGQPIQTLVSTADLSAGNYSAEFNADNLPNGIYYYVLQVGKEKITKKVSLLK